MYHLFICIQGSTGVLRLQQFFCFTPSGYALLLSQHSDLQSFRYCYVVCKMSKIHLNATFLTTQLSHLCHLVVGVPVKRVAPP